MKAAKAITRRGDKAASNEGSVAAHDTPGRVDLTWSKITLTLVQKDGSVKSILNNVAGAAKAEDCWPSWAPQVPVRHPC